MSDKPIDRSTASHTTDNIALIGRFIDELLDSEEGYTDVPDDTPLVLAPVDDPALGRANLGLAMRAMERGTNVRIQLVGRPRIDIEAWRAAEITGIDVKGKRAHWPTSPPRPEDVLVVYDQAHDALFVDFFGGRRQAYAVPAGRYTAARIDPANWEIVGYLVVSFLQVAAGRSPILARALRKAQFRAITKEELGGLELIGSAEPTFDEAEAMAVVVELGQLIA
jgi:hypothetical protein